MITPQGNVVIPKNQGRKSAAYELAKREAIEKAWEKVNRNIASKPVEKVALPIALKDMVSKVGNPDGSNITPIQIYGGKSFPGHSGDQEDIQPDQEDSSGSGGDIGEQDDKHTDLAD